MCSDWPLFKSEGTAREKRRNYTLPYLNTHAPTHIESSLADNQIACDFTKLLIKVTPEHETNYKNSTKVTTFWLLQ